MCNFFKNFFNLSKQALVALIIYEDALLYILLYSNDITHPHRKPKQKKDHLSWPLCLLYSWRSWCNPWDFATCSRSWIDWQILKSWASLCWHSLARWQAWITIRWHQNINLTCDFDNNLNATCHTKRIWRNKSANSAAKQSCYPNIYWRKCRLWHKQDNCLLHSHSACCCAQNPICITVCHSDRDLH